jgi:hypothetical protein
LYASALWRARRARDPAPRVIGLDVGDADTDTFLTAFGLGVVGV